MDFIQAIDLTEADIETALDAAFARFQKPKPPNPAQLELVADRRRKVTNVLLDIIALRIEQGASYAQIGLELNLSGMTIGRYAKTITKLAAE